MFRGVRDQESEVREGSTDLEWNTEELVVCQPKIEG
jgi:hypothetical protein